jgi:hypothetical protein
MIMKQTYNAVRAQESGLRQDAAAALQNKMALISSKEFPILSKRIWCKDPTSYTC